MSYPHLIVSDVDGISKFLGYLGSKPGLLFWAQILGLLVLVLPAGWTKAGSRASRSESGVTKLADFVFKLRFHDY